MAFRVPSRPSHYELYDSCFSEDSDRPGLFFVLALLSTRLRPPSSTRLAASLPCCITRYGHRQEPEEISDSFAYDSLSVQSLIHPERVPRPWHSNRRRFVSTCRLRYFMLQFPLLTSLFSSPQALYNHPLLLRHFPLLGLSR